MSSGLKTFKEVLFTLTELVEKEMSREMTGSRGAIVHDAWKNCGTHYLGVFCFFHEKKLLWWIVEARLEECEDQAEGA